MARTEKPDSERSGGAGRQGICSGCPDRFGKTKPAPRLLQHLLRTHVRPRYEPRNQVGVASAKNCSRRAVSSTARATLTDTEAFWYANADANLHARAKEART